MDNSQPAEAIGWPHLWECGLITLLAMAMAAALPLSVGYLAWSWDALNHHVYLGWAAESGRLGRDVIAASSQSYQYPYLYWPVYRLALLEGPGAHVAALWAAFQAAMILPPLWFLSWQLLPQKAVALGPAGLRLLSCAMGAASTVVLAGVDTTSNDLLAAVPLLWALGLTTSPLPSDRRVCLAAALWGVSSAFKLSNAIFLPMLALWWFSPASSLRGSFPIWRLAALAGGALMGFCLAYLPWGWQLWELTGNPFYPWGAGFISLSGS